MADNVMSLSRPEGRARNSAAMNFTPREAS